jgi:PDZ domain-containing protein
MKIKNKKKKKKVNLDLFKRILPTSIVIFLMIALLLTPVPFIKISPGPLFNTVGKEMDQEVISINGVKTYVSKGELNFTTVSETGGPFGRLVLIDAISAWIDPTQAVVPTSDLYPEVVDPEVIKLENERAFSGSQTDAIAAALGYLKIPVEVKVVVDSVVVDSPSDGKIEPGDVVISVDKIEVKTAADVVRLVQLRKPNEVIELTISRDKKVENVLVTGTELKSDTSKASIGISIGPGIDPPYDFKFGVAEVGGPSAGLMLTLGIIDELTENDLTAGKIIAGTGTINYLGEVGPIGGIRQKLEGAQNSGAQLFLAPIDNCDEISSDNYKSMPVVAVSTLASAIKAIETFTKTGSIKGLKTCS